LILTYQRFLIFLTRRATTQQQQHQQRQQQIAVEFIQSVVFMTTPVPTDPEQLFLQNQQARAVDRPHRQKATEELHAFWTRLRSELSEWVGGVIIYDSSSSGTTIIVTRVAA
jgi:hypothetical protein